MMDLALLSTLVAAALLALISPSAPSAIRAVLSSVACSPPLSSSGSTIPVLPRLPPDSAVGIELPPLNSVLPGLATVCSEQAPTASAATGVSSPRVWDLFLRLAVSCLAALVRLARR